MTPAGQAGSVTIPDTNLKNRSFDIEVSVKPIVHGIAL
jgi:hypothetical protein